MNIPLNIDIQQILLHLINFAILFIILYLVLYKPVQKFLAKREEYFANMDQEAKDKLAAAEATEAEYMKRMEDAEKELAAKRAEMLKAIDAEAEALQQDARIQAERIIEEGRRAAQIEHDKIIEQSQDEIQALAIEAAKKLVTDDPYEQFLGLAEEGEGSR